MASKSISDLRYEFYGGVKGQSLADAEYAWLKTKVPAEDPEDDE